MAIDFQVNADIKTTGKDQIDSLEKQLNQLKNTRINVNVDLNGNGLDFTKLFSGIEKQAKNAGKSINTALQTQIETVARTQRNAFSQPLQNITRQQQQYIDNIEKQLRQRENIINKINSSISSKSYDTEISSLNAQLGRYDKNSKQYQDVASSLSELSTAYNQLKIARDSYEKSNSSANYNVLIKAQDKLSSVMQRTKNEMKILSNEQDKLLNASSIASARKSFASYFENNTKATKKYKEEVAQLQEQLNKMATVADKAKFDTDFNNLKSKAIAEGNTGKSWFDDIKRATSQIAQFTGIYGILQNVMQELPRQMVQAVYEIDTSMTSLYKVTDETASRYEEFLNNASTSAQSLGRDISSYVTQTSEWAKLGYTLDQAEQLSKLSSIYANVGDVSDATAVSDMVTAMKAFNIEASNAVTIIDSLNALGKIIAHIYSNIYLVSSYIG